MICHVKGEIIRNACLQLDMLPRMMEHLPASDVDAIEASLNAVDQADIYVGLFAHRYGYVPEGHDKSITEMEYEHALARGIPCLIFMLDDNVPVLPKDMDRGELGDKIYLLKERLRRDHVVGFFTNPDDLSAKVIKGLLVYKEKEEERRRSQPQNKKMLRVFVASPSDVKAERQIMPIVIRGLNKTLGNLTNIVVELWKWEEDAIPGAGEPQSLIDPELDKSDVVVVIFWNRFGMETSTGETGTEREVLRAFERWEKNKKPKILIYFCRRKADLNNEDVLEQKMKVVQFRKKVSNMALTIDYNDEIEFERRVRDDLFQKLVELSD